MTTRPRTTQWTLWLTAAMAVGYGLIAGLHTVADPDLGWQMATARWMLAHHAIPRGDVFSFTAQGKEWIYPVLSQLIEYGIYKLGGYPLLSWMAALACAGTMALLALSERSWATAMVAIVAVPMIALRSSVRADLFSQILFAVFVCILWKFHRTGRGPVWSLPLLMALWVNLHLGFMAGLGMCLAYVGLEAGDWLFPERRHEALRRLRKGAPWLGATLLATLLNPWGTQVYAGMARLMPTEKHQWILELVPMRLSREVFAVARDWRTPSSALYWLFGVAAVAMMAALLRREFAAAVVLLGAAYAATHAVRFVALFAIVVVVIGGAMIQDALNSFSGHLSGRVRYGMAYTAMAVVFFGIVVRTRDLVDNVHYVRSVYQYSMFGAGGPYRFPQGATDFVLQHALPGNVFNDFNSGGFVLWKLDPKYKDYIDGRGAPFGGKLLEHSQALLVLSPDSADWEEEAASKNIHTILLALDREIGESELAGLDKFCSSSKWKPVYLDPFGAVFVEAGQISATLPAIDCKTVAFSSAPSGDSARERAERFNYLLNAASLMVVLDRNDEALRALEEAGTLFDENAFLHYAKGVVFRQTGRTLESEQEFRRGFEQASDEAASALALLLQQQGRYDEEAEVLRAAAGRSLQPYPFYLSLGYAQLSRGRAEEAMGAFEQAEDQSPFAASDPAGQDFRNQIETGRQRAQAQLRHAGR